MALEKTIDRTVIDLMSDSFLKGLLDLGYCGDLSALGLPEEWSEERLLFLQRKVLMPTASLAWRFQSQTIVGRDDSMYCCG